MIADDIRTLLISLASGRIYWDQAPEQATAPYIRLGEVGGETLLAMDADTGIRQMRFQVSAFATTGTAARDLIAQVRGILHYGGTGSLSGITAQGEPFIAYEPDTRLYQASMDFALWFNP